MGSYARGCLRFLKFPMEWYVHIFKSLEVGDKPYRWELISQEKVFCSVLFARLSNEFVKSHVKICQILSTHMRKGIQKQPTNKVLFSHGFLHNV